MDDLEVYRLENRFQVRGIDSEAIGLKYLLDDDRKGVIISGMKGKTGLDIRQAKALCKELPGILRVMGYSV